MKYIGAHVSAAGGVFKAPVNAREIRATALALFTKNQRQWNAKPYTEEVIAKFGEELARSGISAANTMPHASYLINVASPKAEVRERSLAALADEAERTRQLGLELLNFHPGSHLGELTDQEGMTMIAAGVDSVLRQVPGVTLVLETTAGQGQNLGYTFEQLARMIEAVKDKERVGVCIDTCHIFAAGYDVRTPESWNALMNDFERTVGLEFLKGVHLNDSKSELGSRKDRHHSIGKGYIGLDAFRHIMQDPRLDEMPIVLETIEPKRWAAEIAVLSAFARGEEPDVTLDSESDSDGS